MSDKKQNNPHYIGTRIVLKKEVKPVSKAGNCLNVKLGIAVVIFTCLGVVTVGVGVLVIIKVML